jgi:hypothetical protein
VAVFCMTIGCQYFERGGRNKFGAVEETKAYL